VRHPNHHIRALGAKQLVPANRVGRFRYPGHGLPVRNAKEPPPPLRAQASWVPKSRWPGPANAAEVDPIDRPDGLSTTPFSAYAKGLPTANQAYSAGCGGPSETVVDSSSSLQVQGDPGFPIDAKLRKVAAPGRC
jgi:hypothetical protein